MTVLRRLSWVETKLFLREPFSLVFALAFPLIVLVIMAAIFTMEPYSGAPNATTYYVPGALAMAIAAIGFVGVPVQLAAYRERGVLRRFRASGIPVGAIFVSQLAVSYVMTGIASVVLIGAGVAGGALVAPDEPAGVVLGVLVATFALSSIGIAVGSVLPNARAAQGIGLLLFFAGYLMSGGGPPREVMPGIMRTVSDLDPATHATAVLQAPWFGTGTSGPELLGLVIVGAVAIGIAAVAFRWE